MTFCSVKYGKLSRDKCAKFKKSVLTLKLHEFCTIFKKILNQLSIRSNEYLVIIFHLVKEFFTVIKMLEIVAIFLLAVVVAVVVAFLLFNQKKYEIVGYVSSIRTHPLKSAKPIKLQHATVTNLGIEFDRSLFVFATFCTLVFFQFFFYSYF